MTRSVARHIVCVISYSYWYRYRTVQVFLQCVGHRRYEYSYGSTRTAGTVQNKQSKKDPHSTRLAIAVETIILLLLVLLLVLVLVLVLLLLLLSIQVLGLGLGLVLVLGLYTPYC